MSANGTWSAAGRLGPKGISIPGTGVVRLHLGDSVGPELIVACGPETHATETLPAPLRPAAMVPPRRRRRRLIAALVVLVLLFVIGDRVAASAASTAAVQQVVQRSEGLVAKPSVSFGGVPFLTQVAFGKYTDIGIGIDDITPAGGPRIKHLSAHLKGAHIPLTNAVSDDVSTIPVDRVAATIAITFTDLNRYLQGQPGQLVVSAGPAGAVQISGNATDDSAPITVAGSGRLQTEDGQLTVVPVDLHITGTGGFDDLIASMGGLLGLFPPIPIPLPNLPLNLRITGARADGTGIILSAGADHVVLNTGK